MDVSWTVYWTEVALTGAAIGSAFAALLLVCHACRARRRNHHEGDAK